MTRLLVPNNHELHVDGKVYRCAIGASGFKADKREGDKATPIGEYPLRCCYWRSDRIEKPQTQLPLIVIQKDLGWCDDPKHPEYNKQVSLPFTASHENLWREDHVYDLIIPIGYNDDPIIPGKGSAIFMHLARPGYVPTEGCVAMTLEDWREILPKLSTSTVIKLG